MTKKRFTVAGPHRVHGKNTGEAVELDPVEPQTARLLARGQVVPVPSRQNTGGAPTEDAPASESEE